MRHIAVLGAGITGITTAYALARKGYDVTVIDRQRYAAMETSFANGGQLSASNAEVWNSWATVIKGIKWMFTQDAPLLMNPKPSWHKYSWMAEFLGNIPNYRANTIETARLAILSRKFMWEIAAREGIDFNMEKRGILHIYRDKASYDGAAEVSKLYAAGGLSRRAVTPDEMRAIEPTLHGSYYGGFFTESDFTGDIHRFTRGLADAARRQGVRFITEANVETVRHTGTGVEIGWTLPGEGEAGMSLDVRESFDGVVVCAGVGSRAIAARLGDRVNVYPVKGYSITVMLDDEESRNAAPWVSLLDDKTKIVTSRLGADRFRVAGTAEFNGENRDIRADRIRPLVDWTQKLFPGINTSRSVPWAGLRPMLPSMMPKVEPGKLPGVFYNTGHGHLGWTLSCVTAEMIAEKVAQSLPVETPAGANVHAFAKAA
ncbi:D-amino acid dehydrogenase [Ancylobacter sp. 6x-1]|uniref:D-amino acid dehydrogenase n=1 Tax=Ancylobacter crimeensis TaxID=2579147 RepID=A0ABT0DFE7_9HYPH|nr:D-amino acid dehydrogenase [Ancylobacter crimeensis]MCK0198687.1 D-amino acid dehydrogenase [Ancylobacter crimeensis]